MKIMLVMWYIIPKKIKTIIKYLLAKWKINLSVCRNITLMSIIRKTIRIWNDVGFWELWELINCWLFIWNHVDIGHWCKFYVTEKYFVQFWHFCSIANDVTFIAQVKHDYSCLTTYSWNNNYFGVKTIWEPIIIWNDVWIWKNAIIMKWVTIWTWAVIWAWAIVTKDIPPYAIAVWNPAKVIKYRFDEDTIKKLLESERRNRDIEKIKANYNLEFIKN